MSESGGLFPSAVEAAFERCQTDMDAIVSEHAAWCEGFTAALEAIDRRS